MTTDTPTPRTDAVRFANRDEDSDVARYAMTDHARELERDLFECRAALLQFLSAAGAANDGLGSNQEMIDACRNARPLVYPDAAARAILAKGETK